MALVAMLRTLLFSHTQVKAPASYRTYAAETVSPAALEGQARTRQAEADIEAGSLVDGEAFFDEIQNGLRD